MAARRPPIAGVLSLWQPYASAVLRTAERKDIENRSWRFPHPTPALLGIHAGGKWVTPELLAGWPKQLAMPTLTELAQMHRSALLGLVTVSGQHAVSECGGKCSPWARDTVAFHWELSDPRVLTRPVECAGWLRIWQPNDELRAALRTARRPKDG